ncbi:MAG TPA: triose-phosphate isomerase [Gemmatimonadales bacterium]|nr:triose-phosphate isomerase [Gemmatimonadales bacterium]
MTRRIFAANWKMHNGPSDAREFARSFLKLYARRSGRSIYIFPPAASLAVLSEELRDRPDIQVGVQNIHWEDKGAFTGETSASIARDAGARVALVGHSERRHVFGETDEQTALKCAAAVRAGLTPMLCVGELLEEREAGSTEDVVVRQLRAALKDLEPESALSAMIAYEPVWAIGTGRTATPRDASTVHTAIRRELQELLGDKAAKLPILYGGSVNKGNVADLLAADHVDGVLVGGASLEASGWAAIAGTE